MNKTIDYGSLDAAQRLAFCRGELPSASAFKDMETERQALAFLLKRFVDGEHDQDENQAERHMYHDEAEALLAYLGGEVQGHTLVPDEILRKQRDQIQRLTADEQEAADLCDRLSDLLRNTTIEIRGPEEPLKRHGFHDLPSRVKAVVAELDQLKEFAVEMINASFEGGSFDGGDIQDIAVKHRLLRIERREVECGERCACREYGFPAECYRKTPILGAGPKEIATQSTDTENVSRHEI